MEVTLAVATIPSTGKRWALIMSRAFDISTLIRTPVVAALAQGNNNLTDTVKPLRSSSSFHFWMTFEHPNGQSHYSWA